VAESSRMTWPEASGMPGPVAAHRVTLNRPCVEDSKRSLGASVGSVSWYLSRLTPCRLTYTDTRPVNYLAKHLALCACNIEG
jgi:hypothetical protein